MKIEYDPAKRRATLAVRGLDFEETPSVFAEFHITIDDERRDYGEDRWITFGHLGGRIVVIVWTPRGDVVRIISMRKANGREQAVYGPRLLLG